MRESKTKRDVVTDANERRGAAEGGGNWKAEIACW